MTPRLRRQRAEAPHLAALAHGVPVNLRRGRAPKGVLAAERMEGAHGLPHARQHRAAHCVGVLLACVLPCARISIQFRFIFKVAEGC